MRLRLIIQHPPSIRLHARKLAATIHTTSIPLFIMNQPAGAVNVQPLPTAPRV
ncbi:hypothetical protein B4113_3894 [Geobacillus sp. B4113_201601]|nr:hypothetical protein B4113_3894 [Geobacillus sp. B4113_201601]